MASAVTAVDRPAPPRPTRRTTLAVVVAAALGGIVLRIWVLTSQLGVIESDEAVGALIARRLFTEPEWQTFLWGNQHGGSIEAIPTAVLFTVFGASTVVAKLVPVVLFAAAAVVTGLLTRQLSGSDLAGAFAGAIVWLLPGHFVVLSTKAWLYYGASLFLVAAIMFMVDRLDGGADSPPPRSQLPALFALGVLVGLGLWTSVFVFFVAVPAGLWYAVRNTGHWRAWWAVGPGVLLGGLPWWVFNLRYGFASLDPQDAAPSTYTDRLGNFIPQMFPRILGVREPGIGSWVWGGVGRWLFFVLVAALLVIIVRRRRILTLPVVVILGYPFVWAIPTNTIYYQEPRYGIFLTPALAIIFAVGLADVFARPRLRGIGATVGPLAVVAVFIAASTLGIRGLDSFARRFPGNFSINPPPVEPLVDALDQRNIDVLFAEYWISYRLMFETDQRIIATPIEFPRNPEINQLVIDSQSQVWVLPLGGYQDQRFGPALDELGVGYEREEVSDFAVWYLGRSVVSSEVPEVIRP